MITAAPSDTGSNILGVIFIILAVAAYWTPAIVCLSRRHPRAGQIVLINVFLGWTLVGWVVALVMAVSPRPAPVPPWPPPPMPGRWPG